MDIGHIQKKLDRIEDEVRQYFQHNASTLDKDLIKSIKLTVGNIVKHAQTASQKDELVKDLVLLEKLFNHHHFDEGQISPTFHDIKFDLEMNFTEIEDVEPLTIKDKLDSEEEQVRYIATEQKLLNESKSAPSHLDKLLNNYKDIRKSTGQ